MIHSDLPENILKALHEGLVIPALPLALDKNRKLDIRRQRALMRYYLEAGAGGVAVGVHTTQFEIRLPGIDLYEPILELVRDEFDHFSYRSQKPIIRIAGVIGRTEQAVREARKALDQGYHAVLLSLAAFRDEPNATIINHCKRVAEIIPLVGFYLQPAVGGRKLDFDFWVEFAGIGNVIGIKIAPFNRYQTIDVIRGVAASGRADQIALYTGNDDNIIVDLLTEYQIETGGQVVPKRIVGGLLGHWAVWTKTAVALLEEIKARADKRDLRKWLTLAVQVTDSNAAFFDAAHNFSGCIVGLHEVLRRQGLFEGTWTLNKDDVLSPGQKEEIERVYKAYPHLNDDAFIAENLDRWLS